MGLILLVPRDAPMVVARQYSPLIVHFQKLRCLWNRLLCSHRVNIISGARCRQFISTQGNACTIFGRKSCLEVIRWEDLSVNGSIILEIGAMCVECIEYDAGK